MDRGTAKTISPQDYTMHRTDKTQMQNNEFYRSLEWREIGHSGGDLIGRWDNAEEEV
jgi:hypothetical protein